jgi:hypothetical protein
MTINLDEGDNIYPICALFKNYLPKTAKKNCNSFARSSIVVYITEIKRQKPNIEY